MCKPFGFTVPLLRSYPEEIMAYYGYVVLFLISKKKERRGRKEREEGREGGMVGGPWAAGGSRETSAFHSIIKCVGFASFPICIARLFLCSVTPVPYKAVRAKLTRGRLQLEQNSEEVSVQTWT